MHSLGALVFGLGMRRKNELMGWHPVAEVEGTLGWVERGNRPPAPGNVVVGCCCMDGKVGYKGELRAWGGRGGRREDETQMDAALDLISCRMCL